MRCKKCEVASLHVGRIRELQLEVIVDAYPHGEIAGVPLATDNPTEANRIAFALARQTRFVPRDKY